MTAARLRPRLRARRLRLTLIACLLLAGAAAACAPSISKRGAVHILTADSDVNPVMQRYIDRGIDDAERTDARAVVVRLDTPGGLSSSMEKIVQRIQASKVPVIVWVGPTGAKAASAGTFITMSAHVAAMAPGTSIGAAHPIDANGGDIPGVLGKKVENNAAAYARSIAEATGRNADWAEQAVRNSVSASTSEAVQQHIVDYAAGDIDSLLKQADGRVAKVSGEQITLAGLAAAPRINNDMTLVERLLLVLSDPNIAYLLLSFGGLGLLLEFLHPGVFAPGVFGVIMLILAFLSLGTLPVNWAGVALVLFAFVLFGMEIYVSGFGALGMGGVVAFIAGGLILTSTSNPDFQVSRWLIAGIAAVLTAFFLTIVMAIVRMRRAPRDIGAQAMVGTNAVARSDLNPTGFVFLRGERWQATAEDPPIASGEQVKITAVKGLKLTVRRRGA